MFAIRAWMYLSRLLRREAKFLCFWIFLTILLISPFHMDAAIKAIVFDCDGILVDTEELKFQAWEKVLHSRGVVLSSERYQSLIGLTGLDILSQIEKDQGISLDPKIVDEKNQLYWTLQKNGVPAINAMIATVEWAKAKRDKRELRLGVATSASRGEVLFNLNYLKIEGIFDVILSGKEDLVKYKDPLGVNKPQPYIYLEISHQFGLHPSECLVLEDSESGVCAAKRAGCKVIVVPTKWTEQQNFQMADLVLHRPDSKTIVRIIEKFLQEK